MSAMDALAPFVRRAEPGERPLRLAIEGPTGSGKTWGALAVADALGGRTVLVSVGEHGAETLYAGRFAFDRVDLVEVVSGLSATPPGFASGYVRARCDSPDDPRLVAWAIGALGVEYDNVIVESMSEVWGGALRLVDAESSRDDTRQAWARVTPAWEAACDALMRAPANTIYTVRTKRTADGESVEFRDRDRFRPDLIVRLDGEHRATVVKSRYPSLDGAVLTQLGTRLVDAVRSDLATPARETPRPRLALAPGVTADGAQDDASTRIAAELAAAASDTDQAAASGRSKPPMPGGDPDGPSIDEYVAACRDADVDPAELERWRAWATGDRVPLDDRRQNHARRALIRLVGAAGDVIRPCLVMAVDAQDGAEGVLELCERMKLHAPTNSLRGDLYTLATDGEPRAGTKRWRMITGALEVVAEAVVADLCGTTAAEAERAVRRDLEAGWVAADEGAGRGGA